VTVLDTSAVVDYLLADGVAADVTRVLSESGSAAAPDLLVFEVLAVLRRALAREELSESRARGAVEDLGDLAIELFPTLSLRARAFEMRRNLTAADALFVSLAESLDEPLVTKDAGLARVAPAHSAIEIRLLGQQGRGG
jgi:predicted nucleic acid-binding protein